MARSAMAKWLLDPELPGLGVDLRASEVALAHITERRGGIELDTCVSAPIDPGLLRFSLVEPNIQDPPALAKAIQNVLLRAGAGASKRVALTLPDYVARLTIMEIPNPPVSTAELRELFRFRMKKSLPFDLDRARLTFERLSGKPGRFLVGVMHEAVVSQYEEIFSALGFELGLIVPSTLSLLSLIDPIARKDLAPGADYFFLNAEPDYFSLSLVRNREDLSLIRTLGLRADSSPGNYGEDELLKEIIPTTLFYREKLEGQSLERVYYRSLRPDLPGLRELLEEEFQTASEPFNLLRVVPAASSLSLDAALADAAGAATGAAVGRSL